MKVAIRTDASSRIGSGHVRRCKTLADELREQGADVRFVCREQPGHLIHLLVAAGYHVDVLPPAPGIEQAVDAGQTIAALQGFAADWLSVDHYELDEEWESLADPHAGGIFVIDDLANRRHACDVLLDQNYCGDETATRYQGLVPERCVCLLGSRYALLQPAFSELRNSLPPRDGAVRRVLVFFGAVDSRHMTVAALGGLRTPEFAGLALDVVVGHANADAPEIERLVAARPGAALHRDLPSLASLMAKADLVLGAGGTTTWERCCLGVPSIVAITAPNQEPFTTAVAASGAQHSLGPATAVNGDDWAGAVRAFMRSPATAKACAAAARLMTDGLGAQRVTAALRPAHSAKAG